MVIYRISHASDIQYADSLFLEHYLMSRGRMRLSSIRPLNAILSAYLTRQTVIDDQFTAGHVAGRLGGEENNTVSDVCWYAEFTAGY